ncbi:CaiB/BaiF CoA transferase family protein [Tianweitania sediminis]|uniref:CoA transferase n=1 Tax=Tianweitania sediminis TaxID=1502156 RepID=A0A8J7R0A9_9HYPH|nr:CaiB/BaiF CoA-transferase family protein [Tianweitania sediminis]MBP0437581.1 CoA transferase [Tianweitania sediminis]
MGPLAGLRIVEMAGLGPGPFCGMLLSDMGADVIRIDRPGNQSLVGVSYDIMHRGRRLVELNLKDGAERDQARALINKADGLIEGFRPGVMERLGLGPETFEASNPKLVFGRMTGWGQTGPLAQTAGHDINYLSITGALATIGPREKPAIPLNLVGDFGGGALYLAFGMVCGLLEAKSSGRGQVIDAAISDGAAHLMAMMYSMHNEGRWNTARESNLLDGGAAFYETYPCADGKFISVGAIEPRFQKVLLDALGISTALIVHDLQAPENKKLREELARVFASQPRAYWVELLEALDGCTAPVLDMAEAPEHPHNKARDTFVTHQGVRQPAPAPRFSRTVPELQNWSQTEPVRADTVLDQWKRRH